MRSTIWRALTAATFVAATFAIVGPALGTPDAGVTARRASRADTTFVVRTSPADFPHTETQVLQPAQHPGPVGALLVRISHSMPMQARPGAGPVVGTLPAGSKYYGAPIVACVQQLSPNGRFGEVQVPYAARPRMGWIRLRGLPREHTFIEVRVDISQHLIWVLRGGKVILRGRAGTGAPSSPTPAGRYFVTDRVPFPGGGALGTFAFGISGIQPHLPVGWTGGDQLAIHGTNEPWTIGRSASAGCVHVAAPVLLRLEQLLRPGTPVVIVP